MTEHNPDFAPGCFGLGMVYQPGGKECVRCPFQSQCAPLAEQNLVLVREKLGIKPKPGAVNRPRPATPTPHPTGFTPTLPKKVIELLGRIERAGIKVTEALRRGENPFTDKPAFMRITCHLLLRLSGNQIRMDLLQTALESKLEWSPGTAAAHALQAAQALEALGVATRSNGVLRLKMDD